MKRRQVLWAALLAVLMVLVAGLLAAAPRGRTTGRRTARTAPPTETRPAAARRSPRLPPLGLDAALAAMPAAVDDGDGNAESADPPQRLAPEEKSRILHARLEGSGRAREPWMERVPEVMSAWRASQSPELAAGVEMSRPECWRAGCAVVATYRDQGAFAQLSEVIAGSDEFRSWPGWRLRSPPERDRSGRVVVTWYLMGPDPGSENDLSPEGLERSMQ